MIVDTEVLERALDALLAAMVEADAKRTAQPITASLARIFDIKAPIPTRSEMDAAQLVRELVYFALRQGRAPAGAARLHGHGQHGRDARGRGARGRPCAGAGGAAALDVGLGVGWGWVGR